MYLFEVVVSLLLFRDVAAHIAKDSPEPTYTAEVMDSTSGAFTTPMLSATPGHASLAKRASPPNQIINGGTWQYEGCYWDNPKGSSFPFGPIGSASDNNRTVDNCVATCLSNGYNNAGIENTYECWCGTGTTTGSAQLDNSLCSTTCPGNSNQNCGGNPDRFMFYVLNGPTTLRGPASSSVSRVSRSSVSSASRASASSVASVSRASLSSVVSASRASVSSVRASLSSVASVSRQSVMSSKSLVSVSRASARSKVSASRASVTSVRSVATLSQITSRLSRSSVRSVATSQKLSSISARKSSLTSQLSASRASIISKKSSSLNSKLSSIAQASASRASVSSVRSVSLISAASSRSALSASRSSVSSVASAALAGNVYRAIGCYNHSSAAPALPLHPIFAQISINRCATKCLKHIYMGLFNGNQCWCGDAISRPAVNFSLCFFGNSQGCATPGFYTQDCGSAYNMYILGKVSYFGMCDNTNPIWAGKCLPVTASGFPTTTTTAGAKAKRTAIPGDRAIESPLLGDAPFMPQHAGVDALQYHLSGYAGADTYDGVENEGNDRQEEKEILYVEDIPRFNAEPTPVSNSRL